MVYYGTPKTFSKLNTVQKTAISSSQFLSSSFLQQLSSQSSFQLLAETNNQSSQMLALTTSQADVNQTDLPVLVMSADALNLEKLWLVQQAVSDSLAISAWQIHAPRSQVNNRVIARALCSNTLALESLNALLENIAEAQQVEVSMAFPDAPVLSQPGLLVMDMDSTVINVECIDQIAFLAGVGDEVAKVTEQAMQGELDFSASLRQRVACLQHADEGILQQVQQALPLMPGIEVLVNTLKQQGWKVAIASGGFTYFANYLKERLGLDAAFSNELAFENGKLTGEVLGEIVDAQKKADVVVQLAEQYGIPLSQTVAMGDGANDLVMMGQAQLGVAYKAKPIVRQKAQTAIRFGGLDMMLEYLC